MDVYMYASADTPSDAATACFLDISELYRMKFLGEDSTVWLNAEAPEAGMWVLTDRSTYVKVYRNTYAGWLRLTRSHVRWARTFNATTRDAIQVLDIRAIPEDTNPVATIVMAHRERGTRVRVVGGSAILNPDAHGVTTFDPFSVVDLNNFIPPDRTKTVSPYEAAHAMINGAAVMACTSHDGGEFIRSSMDQFKVELDRKTLDFLANRWGDIENYAQLSTKVLVERLIAAGKSGGWSSSTLEVL